jgi:hypothetical protein
MRPLIAIMLVAWIALAIGLGGKPIGAPRAALLTALRTDR